MADKKKSGISVMPVFVDGEQPSAAKFNSIGAQVKRSDYIIESSIGDIWGESYPYSTFSDAKLSLDRIKASGSEYIDPSSLGRNLDIASLGRIIGPASYLNVEYSCYDENGIANHQISHNVPKGVNQFTLKYIPSTDPTFTDTAIFSNKVANPEDLSSPGDYYMSPVGNVITVTPTDNSVSIQAAYKSKPLYWNGGGDEIGAGYNVIPDPAQLSTALTATESHLSFTEESDGVYLVQLPKRYRSSGGIENLSNTLSSYHLDRGQRYILPIAISLICGASNTSIEAESSVSNVEIPEGMLYLKNESTGEIYTEATYYYVSKTEFRVQLSQTLDIGVDTFSVITVGANITSSIRSLRDKYKAHSHSREFGEELISIEDIDGIFKKPGESGVFIPSNIENNYMPQYLHRDGSRGADAGLNDDNAMRGNLTIGRRQDANGNDITEAGNYTGTGDTFSVSFGNGNSKIVKYQEPGGYLSNNEIRIESEESEMSVGLRSDSGRINIYSDGESDSYFSTRGKLILKSRFDDLQIQAMNGTTWIGSVGDNEDEIRTDSRRFKFFSGAYLGSPKAGSTNTEVTFLESNPEWWQHNRNVVTSGSEFHTPRWSIPRVKYVACRINALKGFWRDTSGTLKTNAYNGELYTSNSFDLPNLSSTEIIAGVDVSWSPWGSEGTFTGGSEESERQRYINGIGVAHHGDYADDVKVYTGIDFIQEDGKAYLTLYSPGKKWPGRMNTGGTNSGGYEMGSLDVIVILKIIDVSGE